MRNNLMMISLMSLMIGCGQAPAANQLSATQLPESDCVVKDDCTYSDVAGYQCQALRYDVDAGDGASLPASFFNGASCVITKQDYQTSPDCDPTSPSQMCSVGGGWGSAPAEYPCCQLVQGPGAPVSMI